MFGLSLAVGGLHVPWLAFGALNMCQNIATLGSTDSTLRVGLVWQFEGYRSLEGLWSPEHVL